MKTVYILILILVTGASNAFAGIKCEEKTKAAAENFIDYVYNPTVASGPPYVLSRKKPTYQNEVYTFEIYEDERGGKSGHLTVSVNQSCTLLSISVYAVRRVDP